MATKKADVKTAQATQAVPADTLKYRIEFPDGSVSEGTTSIREFAPNIGKGFKNSGFQCKVASGNYSGSIMIVDYLKQVRL